MSWSLVFCCHSDPLKHSESQQNHYIWDIWSANRWNAMKTSMTTAGFGQQNGPNSLWQHLTSLCRTNASKVEGIRLQSFASSVVVNWSLANWLPILQASQQLLQGKNLPQPVGGRKCSPRVHQIPKHRFLQYRNIQTYFSLAKLCWW